MHIRAATERDSADIASIHTVSWQHNYSGELSASYLENEVLSERVKIWGERLSSPSENQHVAVAEIDGEIVGFVCVYANENPRFGAYLDNLHVSEGYQCKGIGRLLIKEAARWVFARDPQQGMCLLVNQSNHHAQRLYLSLGANNAESSVWHAPDGTDVPTYWFVWKSLDALVTE